MIPVELIKIPKSKKKPLNSFSPFLEPLPEPTIPWNEAEKIKSHNIKVKKQKFRENMKHKKEKLQKIEVYIFTVLYQNGPNFFFKYNLFFVPIVIINLLQIICIIYVFRYK